MKSGLPESVTLIPGLGPPAIHAPGSASQFDYALFSLAKNSPTLATLGAAPGDLFVIPTEASTLLVNVGGNSTLAEQNDAYSVDPSL